MNFEEYEENTGWRPVFYTLPATKSMAQKAIMPLGFFYSPFLAEPQNTSKGRPAECSKCKAALHPFCTKQRQFKKWICNFCGVDNGFATDSGNRAVEQYTQGKASDTGLYFIIDLCMSSKELESVKETLIKTIKNLPQNIFVGLLIFNKNVHVADFEGQTVQYITLSGNFNYSANNYKDLYEILGFTSNIDPRHISKVINSKYYVPISKNQQKLIEAIEDLQPDTHHVPRELRQIRATGAAFQVAIRMICSIGINTRFVSTIAGPCTIGPGQVVDLPLKKTIRVYLDIIEGNDNIEFMKQATKFYEQLEKIVAENKCTFDIWAYGLDQFGLLQMKSLCSNTGGILAMHEQFTQYIFKESFQRFYSANEAGMFNFPMATTLRIRISKEMKLNGILGPAKSLKQNTLKTAADMEIGQGGTNQWYLGGCSTTNALCLIVSHSEVQNKQKNCCIQAITTFKYSDNVIRHKVSTINLNFIKETQLKEMIRGYDEQASAVMMARISSQKAQIQQSTQVKKWVDRTLLKFAVRFSFYNRGNINTFRLPQQMQHFPQYMYHLRRSGIINPFGSPPDQSIYHRSCLMRQSIPNCSVMIQSALLKYTVQESEPESVQMDSRQLKEDVVLLMDSYFTVIVWNGEHIQGWKEDRLNEDPQYEYLNDIFEVPMRDASQIIYDRLPVSNFYETFKNDGKQRYLKARVNPSATSQQITQGYIVTDDAPIDLFMKYLAKSVVTYND